ncbi:hypothetical protein V8G54_007829 [Vigna mungo]|uniref:Uncharacterized protein n=1 Tax=Vigna mungo TaxID=3915 RepID=A0AAQ3S7N4_VIGMU
MESGGACRKILPLPLPDSSYHEDLIVVFGEKSSRVSSCAEETTGQWCVSLKSLFLLSTLFELADEGAAAMASSQCSERGRSLGGGGRGSFPPSIQPAMVDAGSVLAEPMSGLRRQQRGRVTALSGDDNVNDEL